MSVLPSSFILLLLLVQNWVGVGQEAGREGTSLEFEWFAKILKGSKIRKVTERGINGTRTAEQDTKLWNTTAKKASIKGFFHGIKVVKEVSKICIKWDILKKRREEVIWVPQKQLLNY